MAGFDPIAAGFIPAGAAPGNTAPATGGTEPPPVAAANPPGFEDLIKAQVARQNAMNDRAQNYASDMFPLLKAKQELGIAPTGHGSEAAYNISSLMRTYTPEWAQKALSTFTPVMTPEQTDAYAQANKYLTMAQLGVQGAGRSDAGLSTAGQASPSVTIPNAAAKIVVDNMIGLRRMEHDQALQWQQSGLPIQALQGFVTGFQTKVDPRVYIWDQYTPEQRSKIASKMKPAQYRSFMQQVDAADRRGIYNTFGMDQ